jgi:hypothetical protein
MRRLLLVGVLVVGALSGLVERQTFALFTSDAGSTGNRFAAGTLTLAAGVASGNTLAASNLVPGDSFIAQLDAQNGGNVDLRYAMTTSWTPTPSGDPLANGLRLTVRTKTGNPCSSKDGAVLYGPDGVLSGAAIGDPAQGQQTGDRLLGAGASEALCFEVSFPANAATGLQGSSITPTFTFAAEQQ